MRGTPKQYQQYPISHELFPMYAPLLESLVALVPKDVPGFNQFRNV